MRDFKFFACRDSVLLGEKIAMLLGKRLAKLHVSNFADGDLRVWVEGDVKGKNCVVLQTTRIDPNNRLMELCLTISALKLAGAKLIMAVVPCLGYSRQHRVFQKGETNAALLVARFLETAGANRVCFVVLHNEVILKFFRIPAFNLKTDNLFLEKIKNLKLKDFVILAPDFGSAGQVEWLSRKLKAPLVKIKKRRKIKGFGKEDWCEALGIMGKVSGKDAVIVDDEISSGGTVAAAVKMLGQHKAGKIYVFATHPVFGRKTYENLSALPIKKIFVTDTIPLGKEAKKSLPNLEVISIANLLAEAIKKHI
jgi:ribose-phosphate pyrophosphokinase